MDCNIFSYLLIYRKSLWKIRKYIAIHKQSGEGDGTPLQYSWLENPMGRGAWWATVHGVAESDMTKQQTLSTLCCAEVICLFVVVVVVVVVLFVWLVLV